MERSPESKSARLRLASSVLGAVGFHAALFAFFPTDSGTHPVVSSAIASLGVEVSLDAHLGTFESGPSNDVAEPSDAQGQVSGPTFSARSSAFPEARTESAATDSIDPGAGIGQYDSGLFGLLNESGAPFGVGSGPLRGVSRSSLRGDGASMRADQKARLAPGSTACADLFPYKAGVTRGEVTATLDVDSDGRARLVKLENARPTARGFEAAASACARRLRFEPARDAAGQTIASMAQVKLVFQRES